MESRQQQLSPQSELREAGGLLINSSTSYVEGEGPAIEKTGAVTSRRAEQGAGK